MEQLTYAEIGATQHEPLPAGYRHLHYRTRLGHGGFDRAAEAVLSFRMHEAAGERLEASARRAAPGVTLISRVGIGPFRLRVPCQVVWVEDRDDLAGFGYGTLPGHPARGEESFVVTRDGHGDVWFTVTAFSVPARWDMRIIGPLAPVLQAGVARIRAATLRRLYKG